tara:strand:+ start:147 stop:566 length:420 start_codon:yes stop_codon:yes gene_type:complete
MISTNDIAYIAGLFDGEGSIQYKKYWEVKKKHKGPGTRKTHTWRIKMEMAMTDQDVIHWVHETLKVGTVRPKKVDPKNKKQWRWRCSFRDAYYVARLLWPYAKTKLHKIEQIIDHYSPDYVFEEKVVSLQQYREAMNLE